MEQDLIKKSLDLASGELLNMHQSTSSTTLRRVMTAPGIISDIDSNGSNLDSDRPSSVSSLERKIIVANMLPLHAEKDVGTGKWCFSLDEDSLYLHLKDGFAAGTEVIYVGSLQADVDVSEQEEVSQRLLDEFNCVPTFLSQDIQKKYYHGFCKQHLWPLFHYMLPMCQDHGERFDPEQWQAYVSANKTFADRIMEVVNPEDDYIWIHDYHLMVLPTFLRKRYNRAKIGFFLHSPFPSSEIYRTLSVRREIMKGLLNSDLIGFHTFDYARHFLSCCSRMFGLDYESKRGHIGLEYFGRMVYLKIMPVGIHMGRLESVLNLPSTSLKVKEILEKYNGKKIIIGVDDMDIFKGISLKLLAFEQLLLNRPELIGTVVLIQIVNPARSTGKDVQEARRETYFIFNRINEAYGSSDYEPVTLIDRPVPRYEKSAYYSVADCCIVSAVRDGMNLVPYKYIVCREGVKPDSPRTSMLVVSEFIGCSPSLSGAIRINPWDIDAVANALNSAIYMSESEKQLRHEKHYRYVSTHDVAYWSRSFALDLEKASKDQFDNCCWGIGLGLGFRVVSLSPSFRKLSLDCIASAYSSTSRRAIFLDYDGTVVPQSSILKSPTAEVEDTLKNLCKDPKNTVFIVSGRGRSSLSEWLSGCEKIGLAAEHGHFIRWNKDSEWTSSSLAPNLGWKEIVEPVMKCYVEATDGSYIEAKESALVWHFQDSDPDYGSCQAKELLIHLESVLSSEPAVVKRGLHIVEVKPQGISKGVAAETVLAAMAKNGDAVDFVMCIGDDRSDEDMYESILNKSSYQSKPEIFACTVGQKPSKAKYYLDDTSDVIQLLQDLATTSDPKPTILHNLQVSFDIAF